MPEKPETFVSIPHSCGSNTYTIRKEITDTYKKTIEQEWIICMGCKARILGNKRVFQKETKEIYENKQ